MLDYLIKENGLLGEDMDKKNCLTEAHIQLIKRLINPEIDYEKDWPYPDLVDKSFLFEVKTSHFSVTYRWRLQCTYRLWPTRGTGLMWTNGTTSRGTVTILELPAALTLTEQCSSFVLLKWKDFDRSASGTRYSISH